MITPYRHAEDIGGRPFIFYVSGCCPHCNKTMIPASIKPSPMEPINNLAMYAFRIKCSNTDCGKYYISFQSGRWNNTEGRSVTNQLFQYPTENTVTFSDTITDSFPRFVQAYNEANTIYHMAYVDLAGTGFRRALELLIHDYALMFYTDDTEFIENPKTRLSDKINKFCDSEELKALARASSWIANDFVHPVRRHNESVEQLIEYTDAFISFITIRLIARKAEDFLKNGQSQRENPIQPEPPTLPTSD